MNCPRELYTFNGNAAAEREARWTDAEALAAQALGDGEISPISPMVALVARGRVRARRGAPDAKRPLDEAW